MRSLRRPWTLRLCEATRIRPLWGAIGSMVVLSAAVLLCEAALRRFALLGTPEQPPELLQDLRISLVFCALFGFLSFGETSLIQSFRRTWAELRPSLRCDDRDLEAAVAEVGCFPRRSRLAIVGLVAPVPLVLIAVVDQSFEVNSVILDYPEAIAVRLLAVACGVATAAAIYGIRAESVRLGRFSET